jgi:hypothetical protein
VVSAVDHYSGVYSGLVITKRGDALDDVITSAVSRLTATLPLKPRQQQLEPALVALHRDILHSFVEQGRPLTRDVMDIILDDEGAGIDAALERLRRDDLIVLDRVQREVEGAYPVTVEETPHQVKINGHTIHAMCALDAVSISPPVCTGNHHQFTLSSQWEAHPHPSVWKTGARYPALAGRSCRYSVAKYMWLCRA